MGDPGALIVLGSGTAVPLPDRGSSCYLLRDGRGTTVLVDLGPGALLRAARAGSPPEDLDAVLVTHVHPDHTADLVALQFALMNPGVRAGQGPLPLIGHPALALLVARVRNAWPRWLAVGPERLALRGTDGGPLELPGGWRAEAVPLAHHASSLGWRLTLPGGQVVAFSGDAAGCGGLERLLEGADLAVLEAAGPDEAPLEGHLTPARAGALAAAAGVRRLVLTHFYPETLAGDIEAGARQTFEGDLRLAQDGALVPLPPAARSP